MSCLFKEKKKIDTMIFILLLKKKIQEKEHLSLLCSLLRFENEAELFICRV